MMWEVDEQHSRCGLSTVSTFTESAADEVSESESESDDDTAAVS